MSINWVKPFNLRKNVEISEPAANVPGNRLNLLFFEYGGTNLELFSKVTSPSLKSAIDKHILLLNVMS